MQQSPAGSESSGSVAEESIQALRRLRDELGPRFPRIVLFLFHCTDPDVVCKTLARIPKAVDAWIEEVVVVEDRPRTGDLLERTPELTGGRPLRLRVHRAARAYGYGGARKASFEYAIRSGFDIAVTMRGDGTHPPEVLPDLLRASIVEGRALVLASRLSDRPGALRGGMSPARVLAHAAATGLQNRILGMRLRDHHSSYRLYPVRALQSVPFQLNRDDRAFDVEILIQLRALGIFAHEVSALPAWREGSAAQDELSHLLRACRTAVDYRLHQLHVTRQGRYLVDHGVHYTLKRSETGSHMQLVGAIRAGSEVLDLGCSQGLLAQPLLEKGVRVAGVDARPPERLAPELEEYHQRDLELPLELPYGRRFDYVVVADVIEHVLDRQQLLRGARRFLKEGGRLLISTPNIALWFYRLSLLVGRFEYGPRGVLDRTHVHLYTRATFRREIERAGFHVLRERVTTLPFELVFESTGRSRLVRALSSFSHRLARWWPEMFAYQFILEAEITTLDEEAVAPEASRS